ncbi:ankyrin repeat-containing protein [Holotrichia oblita]|uniref:Ankyrin repeat-containing protein n=1 Tax=Holotrichia oblita TaxID=644536 RepID=A0ACB9TYL4_HOLOL|nr:ankyrin repeat-containing protein [Holotrichia oblita]
MSHSDSELKSDQKLRLKRMVFKTKRKGNPALVTALKSHIHPELQEQRLLKAVSVHNTEDVEKLLHMGVSPNSCDRQLRSALHIAASRGYADIVDLLLKYGADANKRDIIQNTPLHLAACMSNLKIITLLINGGANIRSLDLYGRNPLQLARIVDIMISLWKNKDSTAWGHHRHNIDDLEMMKLTIDDSEPIDDQMSRLLSELKEFTIK